MKKINYETIQMIKYLKSNFCNFFYLKQFKVLTKKMFLDKSQKKLQKVKKNKTYELKNVSFKMIRDNCKSKSIVIIEIKHNIFLHVYKPLLEVKEVKP